MKKATFIAASATLAAAVALPGVIANADTASTWAGYQVPITVTGGDVAQTDAISEEHVDFGALFEQVGSPGSLDEASLRVDEVDGNGTVIGGPYLVQFDEDAPGASTGDLLFQLPGALPAHGTRKVVVSFDHAASGAFSPQVGPAGAVTVSDTTDEGQNVYKISTPRADWYLQKKAGAFSSVVDAGGVDWVGWHPKDVAAQFAGEYRGIGQLNDHWFHPDKDVDATNTNMTVQSTGSMKATFQGSTNGYTQKIEVYPTFTRSTFTATGADPWWFLYEGTPGGDSAIQSGAGTVYRSDGGSAAFNGNFSTDMGAPSWVGFAVPGQNRTMFFSHGQSDGEEGYHSSGQMTIFGFGRNYPGDSGKINPGSATQSFTYGILETASQSAIGSQVAAINSQSDANIDPGGAVTPTSGTTPTSVTQPSGPTPAAGFVPVTPTRLLDTRNAGGAVAAGTVRSLVVRGTGTPVAANADAVVLNVTATSATQDAFVRVWPSASTVPETSSLNVSANDTVPNLVTTAVGANNSVDLQVSNGSANLIVDVVGYYASAVTTGGYHGVNPVRALDTREAGFAAIGPDGALSVDVAAKLGVDPAQMAGVALNVTVTAPTAGGYVSLYPTGGSVPNVSNLNFAAGQTVANAVVVGTSNGSITAFNKAGTSHVIIDVVGWYETGTGGAHFHGIAPVRAFDTRTQPGRTPVLGGQFVTGVVAANGLGVDPTATAVVSNITVTEATANAFITAWPAGETQPWASMQNTVPGTTRANQAMVKVGADGKISVANSHGSVQVITDVVGYFA